MKKDLFSACFEDAKKADPSVTNTQVQEIFCRVCKNRECGRASWATSTWDTRISTQVDRLILNPNITSATDSSRWQGLSNFENFVEPNKIEVWGNTPKETPPLIIIDPSPIPPPVQPNTSQVQSPKASAFNTPPPNGSLLLGGNTQPKPDPWAAPTPKLKVGGTFKMGG